MPYISKLKDKNYRIISIVTETAFDKIPHPLIIKILQKMVIEGSYLNIIKAIYNKSTGNIIFDDEKMKVFPLRSGTRQAFPLLSLLFKIVLEVPKMEEGGILPNLFYEAIITLIPKPDKYITQKRK